MENSRKYRTKEFRKKKLKKRIIKFSFSAGLFLGFVFLLSYISHLDRFQVSNVIIEGNSISNQEEILEKINSIMSGRRFLLFPKSNFLFIPKDIIEEFIIKNNVSVEGIKINLKNFNEAEINIIEYEPKIIWCPNFLDEVISQESSVTIEEINLDQINDERIEDYLLRIELKDINNCYLINHKGISFARMNQNGVSVNHDELMVFYSNPLQHSESQVGNIFIEPETFFNILDFIERIKDLDIQINHVATNNNETFHLRTNRGPRILISRFNDPEQTAINLSLTISLEEINAAQFRNLEYIDLRFGNRVFYRIK